PHHQPDRSAPTLPTTSYDASPTTLKTAPHSNPVPNSIGPDPFGFVWLSPITANGPLLTADSLRVDSPPAGSSRIPVILSRPRSDTPPTPVDGEGVVPAAENRGGNEEAPRHCASDTRALPAAAVKGEVPSSPAKPRRPARRRASDAAIMNIPWPEYLRVVQAVAALTLTNPPDSTAASAAREQLEEVLTRWGVNPQAWLVQLAQLERRSTRALGAPQRMVQRAADVAQRWLQGISLCREIFAEPRSPAARSDEFT
ncbi:MAG: hypothetical protein ACYC4B_33565, partial [Pirellulaceae bacterium]